ncbi:MAG: transglutaminase family protein [Desulfosudis oleivorans]|nr:transglutaminase family protein [Desulfosudis oleivorans]
MKTYLESSDTIDWRHPMVSAKAAEPAAGGGLAEDIARRCFEFVRDAIRHSWDYRLNPVTCRASEVLQHGTGYCYAKSHLLAALLRANGIPAGLCYQRLSIGSGGPPYCLHGLNAVWLDGHGWYRIDARGNKPGVTAGFCPPREQPGVCGAGTRRARPAGDLGRAAAGGGDRTDPPRHGRAGLPGPAGHRSDAAYPAAVARAESKPGAAPN